MIYWNLFKNRFFWLSLCCLSLFVGYWSFLKNKEKQKLIDNASTMYCLEYRDTIEYPSILVIVDFRYADEYVKYFSGRMKTQNFRSFAIDQGSKVKVLQKKYDKKLVKAILVDEKKKGKIYDEFWIWHRFLTSNISKIDSTFHGL